MLVSPIKSGNDKNKALDSRSVSGMTINMKCKPRVRYIRHSKGQVLYIVLIVLFVLITITTLFAFLFNFKYKLIRKEADRIHARYLAESGIYYMLEKFERERITEFKDKDMIDDLYAKACGAANRCRDYGTSDT